MRHETHQAAPRAGTPNPRFPSEPGPKSARLLQQIAHMKCKQCNAEISDAIAAETTRKVKNFIETLGLSPMASDAMIENHTPLCRKCMQTWGANEDDLAPPAQSSR
jgi:hypothetical protein